MGRLTSNSARFPVERSDAPADVVLRTSFAGLSPASPETTLEELHKTFARLVSNIARVEGVTATVIPGVYCARYTRHYECRNIVWPSSLVFAVAGEKQALLEKETYTYHAGQYIASPVDLPIGSRIPGTKENPFLCISVPLPRAELIDILKDTKLDSEFQKSSEPCKPFVGETTEPLLRCGIRLAEVLDRPDDARVIGPLIIREMIYHFLRSENGSKFLNYVRKGDRAQKVASAVETIKADPSKKIDLDAFAAEAHMSRANFFRTFKSATAMSPVQYQKQLRLVEARRLLLESDETVESAAYKVGYKSTSQFSRDYARRFGSPPKRDTRAR